MDHNVPLIIIIPFDDDDVVHGQLQESGGHPMYAAMTTNSLLHNGAVFPNKLSHFQAGMHEIASYNLQIY